MSKNPSATKKPVSKSFKWKIALSAGAIALSLFVAVQSVFAWFSMNVAANISGSSFRISQFEGTGYHTTVNFVGTEPSGDEYLIYPGEFLSSNVEIDVLASNSYVFNFTASGLDYRLTDYPESVIDCGRYEILDGEVWEEYELEGYSLTDKRAFFQNFVKPCFNAFKYSYAKTDGTSASAMIPWSAYENGESENEFTLDSSFVTGGKLRFVLTIYFDASVGSGNVVIDGETYRLNCSNGYCAQSFDASFTCN